MLVSVSVEWPGFPFVYVQCTLSGIQSDCVTALVPYLPRPIVRQGSAPADSTRASSPASRLGMRFEVTERHPVMFFLARRHVTQQAHSGLRGDAQAALVKSPSLCRGLSRVTILINSRNQVNGS